MVILCIIIEGKQVKRPAHVVMITISKRSPTLPGSRDRLTHFHSILDALTNDYLGAISHVSMGESESEIESDI